MVSDSVSSSSLLALVGSRWLRSPCTMASTVCWMPSTRSSTARRIITPPTTPGYRQHRDSRRQTKPETRRKRRKQRLIAADQQVVAAGKHSLARTSRVCWTGQRNRQVVYTGCAGTDVGHSGRLPARRCSVESANSRMRSPGICMPTRLSMKVVSPETPSPAENLRQPLSVGAQDFRAAILQRHLPGVPEGGGEQNERGNAERYVAKRQRKRRRSEELIHPRVSMYPALRTVRSSGRSKSASIFCRSLLMCTSTTFV